MGGEGCTISVAWLWLTSLHGYGYFILYLEIIALTSKSDSVIYMSLSGEVVQLQIQ